MEDAEALLDVPNLNISCAHNQEDIEAPSKRNENGKLAIALLIFGMVLTVIKKYWIISIFFAIAIIFIFISHGILLGFISIIFSLFAIIYQISDQLVYWPNFPLNSRSLVRLPSSIGLASENLYLYAKDGTKLHAVFVKQESKLVGLAPTVIYLHGNAGNMGHRLGNIYELYRIVGVNLLLLEYRGYGLSEGQPSESGLYWDAEAALCYLRTRSDIDTSKIIMFGRSLGGAVAIDVVSRPEVRSRVAALIVENTFTSIPDMAAVMFQGVRVLSSLPVWCHKNKYKSKLKMCRVLVPTLLLSGQCDSLVPSRMMGDLYRACPAQRKKMLKFTSGTHNETWRCRGYYQGIIQFLDEIFHQQTHPSKPLPPGVIAVTDTQVL